MTILRDPEREKAIAREAAKAGDSQLLVLAAELVIASGLGSWQMLHRKLRVGHGHAQRLMNALQAHGIVGEDVGDPRDVLVTPGELEVTLSALRAAMPTGGDLPPEGGGPGEDHRMRFTKPRGGEPGGESAPAAGGEPGGEDDDEDDGQPPADGGEEGGDDDKSATPAAPDSPLPGPGVALAKRKASATPAPRASSEVATYDDDGGEAEQGGADGGEASRQMVVARLVKDGFTTLRDGEQPAMRATRSVAAYGYISGQGVYSWMTRAARWGNHGVARDQVTKAHLAGDPKEIDDRLKTLDGLRTSRVKRLLLWPKAIAAMGVAVGVAAAVVAFVAVLIGVLAAIVWGGTGWGLWWWLVGLVLKIFIGLIVGGSFLTLVLAVPVTVEAAHAEGVRRATAPKWALPIGLRELGDVTITPHRLILALRDAKIPALKRYIKESPDGGAELLGPIIPEGDGVGVEIRLPGEVSTEDVKKQRRRIAENADRHEHELFITVPKAHHAHMWFADPGALEQPLPPSPLVTATKPIRANMRTGTCPWGRTVRGQEIGINLWQQHLLITGLSNQGKTKAIRALALWLAFDWRVTFWIADLKGRPNDWGMLRDLCPDGYFIAGPGDDEVIATTLMVEAAVAEMMRRLTDERDDWPPLVVIVDEAQVGYTSLLVDADGNPYGGQSKTSRYMNAVRKIKAQGRAVNVVIWEGTQDPTNENLPKRTREASHIRIALVLGTEEQSKMALGAAAVAGGAAPHLLRKDIDKGWVVMHGGDVPIPLGEASLTVRSYFIDDPEAWQVAGRAMEARTRRKNQPVIDMPEDDEPVDHLQHIWEAMRGEEQVRTTHVDARLLEDRPELYADWTSQKRGRVIAAYADAGIDIGIRKIGSGNSFLLLREVERALRERPEVLPRA